MIEVVQAFDRKHIKGLPADDAAELEAKFKAAHARFKNRRAWLPPLWRTHAGVEMAAQRPHRPRGAAEVLDQSSAKGIPARDS